MMLLQSIFRLPELSRRPVFKFISDRSGPFDGEVKLSRDRVYIIPTRNGFIFGLLLIVLLIGSINYEKNLGFILTFLLAGLGHSALLSTWRNIAGLELRRSDAVPVFAGEDARFSIRLINEQGLDRYSLVISHDGNEHDIVDCRANDGVSNDSFITFRARTDKRGILDAGRFRLHTEFPSGLFIAWTWVDLSMTCLVYPRPADDIDVPVFSHSESGDNDTAGSGQENYSHLRKYHQGDSLTHVSWKAAAKTGDLFTKQYIGSRPVTYWIDWSDIQASDNEQRLSIMTRLVIEAEKHQQHYGLRLPQQEIAPDVGNKHYHRCLSALALYNPGFI